MNATIVEETGTLWWVLRRGTEEPLEKGPAMADLNHPRKSTEEFRRQIVQLYLAGKPRGELMAEY